MRAARRISQGPVCLRADSSSFSLSVRGHILLLDWMCWCEVCCWSGSLHPRCKRAMAVMCLLGVGETSWKKLTLPQDEPCSPWSWRPREAKGKDLRHLKPVLLEFVLLLARIWARKLSGFLFVILRVHANFIYVGISMIPWFYERNDPLVHFRERKLYTLPNFSVYWEKLLAPIKLISSCDMYRSFSFYV